MTEPEQSFEERVRHRAYELWEEAGRPAGRADGFWRQARAELEREAAKRYGGGMSDHEPTTAELLAAINALRLDMTQRLDQLDALVRETRDRLVRQVGGSRVIASPAATPSPGPPANRR